jgi:CMP/dCMP kinase
LHPKLPVITFDGPSGSGKGTLSQHLAYYLDWHLLDSGAVYRIAALEILNNDMDLNDALGLKRLLPTLEIDYRVNQDKSIQYFLHEKDITQTIRTPACGKMASRIAAIPVVRAALLSVQRQFLRPPGLVADGRDMGTVVFPNAILKFYITASSEERIKRRYNQLKSKGISVNLSQIRKELLARDARDSTRQISPLFLANDAVKVDTTSRTVEESFEQIKTQVSSIISGPLK